LKFHSEKQWSFREFFFLTKTGHGWHARADKDARAGAVNSTSHRLKMTTSFSFNYGIVVVDCLQFSNQLDKSDVTQGQQCQQNSRNLKRYVGNLLTLRKNDVVNKRNKGK